MQSDFDGSQAQVACPFRLYATLSRIGTEASVYLADMCTALYACMNTRNKGASYRLQTLHLLAATGYASTRQVARHLWGRCDENSRRMARRTLTWLLNRKLVVSKREAVWSVSAGSGELLYALNRAGVDVIKQHGNSLVAEKVHARDYIRHAHSHRSACNSVYVAWPTDEVFSELSVRAGECDLARFEYCHKEEQIAKIPDLVAVEDGRFVWIEVENSWRGEGDLAKLIDCMRMMFGRDHGISRMHFVVTSPAARTIGKRIKNRLTHRPETGWPRQIKELDARILALHIAVSELDPETLELREITL